MKKYRNKKTGVVIEVECGINGRNWEEVTFPGSSESSELSYKELQKKAKSYGIKCVGKSADVLKQLISEHENKQEETEEISEEMETDPVETETPVKTGAVIKARKGN